MHKVFRKEAVEKDSFVIVEVVIALSLTVGFFMLNFDIDFLPDWSGWKKILDGEDYWFLDIRESDNALFLAEGILRENTITIYSPGSVRVSTINAPVNCIIRLEVSDVLWVGSYVNPGLVSYDFISETWNSHTETEAFGDHFGWRITKNGNLLMFGEDSLKEYVDGKWSANYWTLDEALASVYQDDEGVYWAKTAYRDWYVYTPAHHWEYVSRLLIDSGVRIIDGKFWLLGRERLHLWDPAAPEKTPELVRKFTDENVQELIVVPSDTYYVVTSKEIWKFQNGDWEKTGRPIPIGRIHINAAVFDEALQRMYIATDRGVYYKDLPL